MELIKDFKEFIRLLDAHDVRYLVVGGVAVNALGFVRSTEDIDFWLQRSSENADRALAALADFGFGEFSKDDLLDPEAVLMLGRPPYRIDLLMAITARDFDDCYPRRTYGHVGGVRLPLIGLDDLLINKRASGRDKDLADVREFERAGKNEKK
ncbi:MAG: nucleotidyltransferase [Proteobacteria bacterium]|nr:nucleotidyltransferase [Pseudomonadota bacterium]